MVYDIKKVDQLIEDGTLISGVVTASQLTSGAVTTAKMASGAVTRTSLGSGVITALKMDFMTATMLSGSGAAQYIAHNWSGTAPTIYMAWLESALSGIANTVSIGVSTSSINVTATANANYGYLVIK